MKFPKAYTLQFIGLSNGNHLLEYQIDQDFLAHYEQSLVKKAKVTIQLELEKSPALLELKLNLKGTVETDCDFCGEIFQLPVQREETIIVKFIGQMPTEFDDEDEVIYLQNTADNINLADTFYEMLMLSIPTRKIHPDKENGQPGCNPEILQTWQKYKTPEVHNQNNSIWDELKNLNIN